MPRPLAPPPETRAEVARRRLEQLAASFEASAPTGAAGREPPSPAHPDPAPSGARLPGHRRAEPRATPHLRLESVHLRLVAVVAVAAGVLLAWWLLAQRPSTTALAEPVGVAAGTAPAGEPAAPGQAADPQAAPVAATEEADVVVDVAGKVRRPGIVTLPAGSRVHEAIEAAGGLRGDVDTTSLNLARTLTDGEQVLVGVEPVVAAPAASGSASAAPGAVVDLNTATSEQLQELPGVGPVTAGAIVDWRTENGGFAAVEDLLQVTGIGEKTLATLRDLVTV